MSQLTEKIQPRDCNFLQSAAYIGSSSSDYIIVVIELNKIEKAFLVQEAMRAKYQKKKNLSKNTFHQCGYKNRVKNERKSFWNS